MKSWKWTNWNPSDKYYLTLPNTVPFADRNMFIIELHADQSLTQQEVTCVEIFNKMKWPFADASLTLLTKEAKKGFLGSHHHWHWFRSASVAKLALLSSLWVVVLLLLLLLYLLQRAHSHLEGAGCTVRITLFDFSSASTPSSYFYWDRSCRWWR